MPAMPTLKTPPESPPAKPSPAHLRFLLWMSFGYLLGLPVADLFSGVNLQTEIMQRQLGKRLLSYTIAERLRLLEIQKKLGKHLRECFDWIASPQALAKAIKRYQERMAQENKTPNKKKAGRPWLSEEKWRPFCAFIRLGVGGYRVLLAR